MVRVSQQGKVLEVVTPFRRGFVEGLKERVPGSARVWDGERKVWRVDAGYLEVVRGLCEEAFGECEVVSEGAVDGQVVEKRLLVEYLARVKEGFANAWAEGGWTVRFSEEALRRFFEGFGVSDGKPRDATLYGLLGAKREASAEEIKRAYFRASKAWHPDLNRDADAAEMFKRVNEAYRVLSNPVWREKYDAGLKLEGQQGKALWQGTLTPGGSFGYRAPATCGWVTCVGSQGLKFDVSEIRQWDDDVKWVGHLKLVRVSFWEKGKEMFTTRYEVGE